MKKVILLLSLILSDKFLPAQDSQQQKIDSICQLVKQYFNEKNSTKIYDLTGESFRKQLSLNVFQSLSENNLFPLGEMKSTEFESYADGVSKFKVSFTSMKLGFFISLDKKDKIETFLFKPYLDEFARKKDRVPTTNVLITALDKEVDSAVQPYISLQATVGLSIGILKDGRTIFYGYGETARGNGQIPNEHTIFEIGSLSKTFTSILLADAINDGKVQLDDPINKYLPDSIPLLQYEGIPVTIKTLANHSSGIPRMPSNFHSSDNFNPYKDYDQSNMFHFYRNFKPVRKPGEKYEYSNIAVGTLGVILERVNHEKYETLFIKTICKPLGMNETREFLLSNDSAKFAKGYSEDGDFKSQWDFKALAPAGGIRINKYRPAEVCKCKSGECTFKTE